MFVRCVLLLNDAHTRCLWGALGVLIMRTNALYQSRRLLLILSFLAAVSSPWFPTRITNSALYSLRYLGCSGFIWSCYTSKPVGIPPCTHQGVCIHVRLCFYQVLPASVIGTTGCISGCTNLSVCKPLSILFWVPFLSLETSKFGRSHGLHA